MSGKLTIQIIRICQRTFIQIGDICILLDSIIQINADLYWGVHDKNSVLIYAMLSEEVATYEFSGHDADAIREYFGLKTRYLSLSDI